MKGISKLDGKYAVSMDMYPLQDKASNRVHTFYDNLKEGRFTTTKCKACGVRSFPPRVLCPECYSEDMEWVDLPMEGTVLAVAEQLAGVPLGFDAPLIHAFVNMGGEMTFICRTQNFKAGELKAGDKVKIAVIPLEAVPFDGKKGAVIEAERVFYVLEKA
jgi:uncharacterized OB-fold protein